MTIEYEQALWIEFGDRMSRPKDQDQDEPAMRAINDPPPTQTRSLSWTGYAPTVRELRGWLDKIPDQAIITVFIVDGKDRVISATWEIS